MQLDRLLERVPAWARDLKLNMSSLLKQTELTQQQLWGTAVACAIAVRNPELLKAIEADAQAHLTAGAMEAAKSASALMGMSNVYFRFLHLPENPKYQTLPSHLRMNATRGHDVPQADFDLWCIAVSAINNCPACVRAHEKSALLKGMTEETILAAVRIAAAIHALAPVLETVN